MIFIFACSATVSFVMSPKRLIPIWYQVTHSTSPPRCLFHPEITSFHLVFVSSSTSQDTNLRRGDRPVAKTVLFLFPSVVTGLLLKLNIFKPWFLQASIVHGNCHNQWVKGNSFSQFIILLAKSTAAAASLDPITLNHDFPTNFQTHRTLEMYCLGLHICTHTGHENRKKTVSTTYTHIALSNPTITLDHDPPRVPGVWKASRATEPVVPLCCFSFQKRVRKKERFVWPNYLSQEK